MKTGIVLYHVGNFNVLLQKPVTINMSNHVVNRLDKKC